MAITTMNATTTDGEFCISIWMLNELVVSQNTQNEL